VAASFLILEPSGVQHWSHLVCWFSPWARMFRAKIQKSPPEICRYSALRLWDVASKYLQRTMRSNGIHKSHELKIFIGFFDETTQFDVVGARIEKGRLLKSASGFRSFLTSDFPITEIRNLRSKIWKRARSWRTECEVSLCTRRFFCFVLFWAQKGF
jgi:hypothetical protein